MLEDAHSTAERKVIELFHGACVSPYFLATCLCQAQALVTAQKRKHKFLAACLCQAQALVTAHTKKKRRVSRSLPWLAGWLAGWLTLSLPPKRFRNLHPDPCEAWRALVHSDVRGRVFTTCTPNAANPAAQAVSSGMSKCKVYLHARVARFLIPALATPPGPEN